MTLNKKLIVITLILLSLFMIGAVSATSDTTKDIVNSDVIHKEKLTTHVDKSSSDNNIKKTTNTISKNTDYKTNLDKNKQNETNNKQNLDKIIQKDNTKNINLNDDETTNKNRKNNKKNLLKGNANTNTLNNKKEEILRDTASTYSTLMTSIAASILELSLDKNYEYSGGADDLFLENGGLPITKDLVIYGNGKTIDGKGEKGIFRIAEGYNLTVYNLNFVNGKTDEEGGAVYCDGTFTAINCTFRNCNSNLGGAIFAGTNSKLIIENCNFLDNEGNSAGGAITVYESKKFSTTNCKFINNQATYYGGAITIYYAKEDIQINNSTFINNKVTGTDDEDSHGGAIYFQKSTYASIKNSTFINNSATKTDKGDGGAIYSDDSPFSIISSNFTNNNAANYGGAIHLINNERDINIINSTFTNNTASGGWGNGGAIYTRMGSLALNIIESNFTNNRGYDAGAIYSYNNKLIIKKSEFFNNYASNRGGAIRSDNSDLTIETSEFFNNTAYKSGGAISIEGSENLNITGSTFKNNYGEYINEGITIDGNPHVEIKNSTLIDTTLPNSHTDWHLSDTKYLSSISFTIQHINDAIYGRSGSSIRIYIETSKPYSGNASVNISGKLYTIKIYKGMIDGNDGNINGIPVGTHIAIIDLPETDSYLSAHAESNEFTIRYDNEFRIDRIYDTNYGDNITITVNEYFNYTGNINVTFGTKSYTVTLNNGHGSKTINDLDVGTYKPNIDAPETETYSSYNGPGYTQYQFTVRYGTLFTIAPIQDTVYGNSIVLNVSEKYNYTGNVNVKFGTRYYTVTLNNGKGITTISDLPVGIYKAIIDFSQTESYSSTSVESNEFTIKYQPSFNMGSIPDTIVGSPITVNITETHGLNGTATIKIGFFTDSITFNNGIAIKTVNPTLDIGTYKVILNFTGNDEFISGNDQSNEFNVKYNTSFKVSIPNVIILGEPISVNISESNGYSGLVSIKIGTETYNVTLNNGQGITNINNLPIGTYNAILNFTGTNNYNPTYTESNEFNIKYQPTFNINPISNVIAGNPITVNITETHGLNGTATIKIGSFTDTITFNNGISSKTINPKLAVGTYKVILNCTGNNKFIPGNAQSNGFDIKNPSFVDLYDLINSGSSPVRLEYNYVYDEAYDSQFINGIPITQNIVINGENHIVDAKGLARIFNVSNGAQVTIENMNLINGNADNGGAVSASSGTDLIINKVTFANNTASGDGSAIYSEGSINVSESTFNTNPCESGSGIHAANGEVSNSKFIGGDTVSNNVETKDCIFLTEPQFNIDSIPNITVGSPINIVVKEIHGLNGTVTIKINSIEYSIDLVNGKGNKEVTPNLTPGTYKATLYYTGAGNFTSGTAVSNVFTISAKVNPTPTSKIATKITAPAVTTTYNTNKYLVITLKDKNGNKLSGMIITVDLNGAKNYTTNKNGQIKISTKKLTPKTYTTKITFNGNQKYTKSNTTTKITIKKETTKITTKPKITTTYNINKKIVITLKDKQNKPITNTQITVKIGNNTKKYKTNKKGQITISTKKLTPKTYKTKIIFTGNNKYTKSSTTTQITIKKATPKITAKTKTFKKSLKNKKYNITLKNNLKKPMKTATVTLKINNKKYTTKTNKKGIATFTIKKLTQKGTYTATIQYKGDKNYKPIQKTVKITIQ